MSRNLEYLSGMDKSDTMHHLPELLLVPSILVSQLSPKREIALGAVPRYWELELMLLPSSMILPYYDE